MAGFGPLVDTAWLAAHLDDADLRVFDTTIYLKVKEDGGGYEAVSGRDNWQQGHIPGAQFLDLAKEFSRGDTPIAFMMPAPEDMARGLAALGVGDDSRVVFYNDGIPMWATRAWWMLRSLGHRQVAVLDGGLGRWREESRPLTTDQPQFPQASLSVSFQPSMWVDLPAMLAAGEAGTCRVNALAPDVYRGDVNRYGRPGHIPGSYNVFYGDLLAADGTFKTPAELEPLFTESGALNEKRVVTYCGGGISATMDCMALALLGQDDVGVYDGSMSEWVRDAKLPLKLGAEP